MSTTEQLEAEIKQLKATIRAMEVAKARDDELWRSCVMHEGVIDRDRYVRVWSYSDEDEAVRHGVFVLKEQTSRDRSNNYIRQKAQAAEEALRCRVRRLFRTRSMRLNPADPRQA